MQRRGLFFNDSECKFVRAVLFNAMESINMKHSNCFVIILMEHHSNLHSKSTLKYSKISLKKRKQLVQQVIEKKQLLSKAAKKLNIRLSTAKLIVKRYKEDGTFFESKAEKTKRMQEGIKTEVNKQNQFISYPSPNQNTPNPQYEQPYPIAFDMTQTYNYQNLINLPYILSVGPQNTLMFCYY